MAEILEFKVEATPTDVEDLLKTTKEMDFTDLYLVGRKDGLVYSASSFECNTSESVGYIELLKYHIITKTTAGE